MPARNQHQQQATRNEELFRSFDLNDTPYLDWAVISLFYASLHWVDAYLADITSTIGDQKPHRTGGHHPGGHKQRYRKVLSSPDLFPIRHEYKELWDRCDEARYNCFPLTPAFVNNLATNQYQAIKNRIQPLL